MTRDELIQKNKHLFWYIKKESLYNISDDVLVEFIINYGEMEAVKELIQVLGMENLKKVYKNITGKRVGNYLPASLHFLKLIVERFVP